MDAVCRKDACRHLLEVLSLEARVTRERERGLVVVSVEIVGDALGGLRHDIDVHGP